MEILKDDRFERSDESMKLSLKSIDDFHKARTDQFLALLKIFGLLVLITITIGNFILIRADNSPNWFYNLDWGEILNLNPVNTQWSTLDGKLTAISLEQGQLRIFTGNEDSNWVETQSLKPPEIALTTFIIQDINGDGIPEIIAGTTEPGYIYVYKLENGKWSLNNYEKYVWSAITGIAAGNFDGQQFNLLAQNQDGFLYLLKMNNESLDIVWKSPTVWRLINSLLILDIDNDSKQEMVVAYKTGGIGILKLVNNQIVSVWDNYLWGKILALTYGDWDGDKQPEILISTSQKVIYILGYTGKSYQFEDRLTQLNYITETMSLTNYKNHNQLVTTDTAGKFHYSEYDPKLKQWQEQFFCQTGRIAQIIQTSNNDTFLLWSQNRKLITLNAFKTSDFKLKNNDTVLGLTPPAVYQNNNLYIAPKALSSLAGLGISYTETKTAFKVSLAQTALEITKTDLQNYQLNGAGNSNQNQLFIIFDNSLYLAVDSYPKLFNLIVKVDPVSRIISLVNPTGPIDTENGDSTADLKTME
jgi:hypothetical protein